MAPLTIGQAPAPEFDDLLRDHEDLGARWRAHIAREEGELLVHAGAILDAATLADIGAEMADRRNLR